MTRRRTGVGDAWVITLVGLTAWYVARALVAWPLLAALAVAAVLAARAATIPRPVGGSSNHEGQ